MSGHVKFVGFALLVAAMAIGLVACAQTPAPTIAPQVAPPVTEAPTAVPTEVPTVAPQAAAVTPEELLKLRALTYTLADGTTVSPASAPAAGTTSVVVDTASIRKGDLNGDGVEDAVLVLVNTANPQGPEIMLAPVINEGGTYTNAGVITLGTDTDISNIAMGNGEVTATVWSKTADGTAYQVRQATYKLENGSWVEVSAGEPVPAPAPIPTGAPAPVAPEITLTLDPEETTVGTQVDIYVHAFNSTSIVSIELQRDGEKVDEWTSPDPEGVPYQHHTFTWTPDSDGDYEFTAIARDKWGGAGSSAPETLTVTAE
jgi:hypothetical protein